MPGDAITLGPFTKGLHNSAGTGEYIDNAELFELVNLEVDTDGSLANRPAINKLPLATEFGDGQKRVIGTYLPESGKRYLVVSYKEVDNTDPEDPKTEYFICLIDLEPNSEGKYERAVTQGGFTDYIACGVQYYKKFFAYPRPGTSDTGGYFEEAVWTQADLPGHQSNACVVYKERLFAVAGIDSTTDTSRLYFSRIGDPTDFDGGDFIDFEPGNGQKITDVIVLNDDLVVFKEHATYRAGYSSDIAKIEVSTVSSVVGAPAAACALEHNNNIYVLHGNSVYEMYNYIYTDISAGLNMRDQEAENLVEPYGMTLFKNRLFVRFYERLYVYSLLSARWCEWETECNFRELTVLPSIKGDTAYGASISELRPSELYYIKDSRVEGIYSNKEPYGESFSCRVTTKTYDFDNPHTYKVMFWWGMTIATLGDTKAQMVSPNAGPGYTWEMLSENTWEHWLETELRWTSASPVIQRATPDVPAEIGTYSRKFIKFPKKTRFRQAYFEISTEAVPNIVGDASVRIYDLAVFIKSKETVVKRTTA